MFILTIISWLFSILFVVFGLLPLYYNIFNVGCIVLLGLGALAFVFPIIIYHTKKKKALRNIVIAIVSVGVLSFVIVSVLMLRQAQFKEPPKAGNYTLIVLGARVINDYPSLTLKRRLDKAGEYLLSNPEGICIVSGGQGEDEIYPEGVVMKNYLVNMGINESRIFSEIESRNTRQNLRLSQSLIPEDSKGTVIVTDDFHQLRAVITAKAIGMENIYSLSSSTLPALIPAYWVRDLCGVPLTWIEENIINK